LTVYACENQPVVIEGLVRVFQSCADLTLTGHTADLDTAAKEVLSIRPDVVLIGQPPTAKSVLPLLARLRESGVTSQVVLWVTELSDMDSFRALQMGARGVITRTQTAPVLLDCIRAVARGTVWLETSSRAHAAPLRRSSTVRITRREREIIESVCRGMKNKEIAESLSITAGTVKVHLMHIFEKTGVKDRFQLALQGRQILGSLEPEPQASTAAAAVEV
jgi:DNA-binding NarL/FixJ family response regulator